MANSEHDLHPEGKVNFEPLNSAAFKRIIAMDVDQRLYAVSPTELEQLSEGSGNIWKDMCLTCIGLGIPFLINSFILFNKVDPFIPSRELFMNALGAAVTLILGIVSGILWYKQAGRCEELIRKIKGRTQFEL